jgi:two-component system OmpR family sensor kinase
MIKMPARLSQTLGYAFLLSLTLAIIGAVMVVALERSLQDDTSQELDTLCAAIDQAVAAPDATSISADEAESAVSGLAAAQSMPQSGLLYRVINRDGRILASSSPEMDHMLPQPADVGQLTVTTQEIVGAGRDRVRLATRPVMRGGSVLGVVQVGESLHLLDATVRRMWQLLGLAAVGGGLVSLAGGWWLSARLFRGIAQITRTARGIAETGELTRRVQVSDRHDEIGELVATLNAMLDRIERASRRQRDFLADVSHELRGPLTVIRGNLDLLRLQLSAADRQECATEAMGELNRMHRLVEDLLFLTEVDSSDMVAHEPVDLRALVRLEVDRAQTADGDAHELVAETPDAAVVKGDRDRLGQLVWNLVENALKYTPAGGRITISLRNFGRLVELSVADSGIGISPEHLPRIFERFYRVDRSRSRAQGSTGLGLSIVRQVAEAHGGQVRVRSEPGVGTTFAVVLPTAEQSEPLPASPSASSSARRSPFARRSGRESRQVRGQRQKD